MENLIPGRCHHGVVHDKSCLYNGALERLFLIRRISEYI